MSLDWRSQALKAAQEPDTPTQSTDWRQKALQAAQAPETQNQPQWRATALKAASDTTGDQHFFGGDPNTPLGKIAPSFMPALATAANKALFPARWLLNKVDQGQRLQSAMGNAVLGVGRREVQGLLGAHQAGDYGPKRVMEHALYAGLHPSEEQNIQQQAETAVGVNRLRNPNAGVTATLGPVESAKWALLSQLSPGGAAMLFQKRMQSDPGFAQRVHALPGRLRNMGIDFTFDMLTDPLNLLFMTDAPAATLTKLLKPAGEAVMGAEKLQPLMEFTRTGHRMKQETGAPGWRTHTSLENAVDNNARMLEEQGNATIKQHGPAVDEIYKTVDAERQASIAKIENAANRVQKKIDKRLSGPAHEAATERLDRMTARQVDQANVSAKNKFLSQVPPELRNYYGGWLYRLGGPRARRQAIAAGFSPSTQGTEIERTWQELGMSPPPLNLIEQAKNFKAPKAIGERPTIDYFPQTRLTPEEAQKELQLFQEKRVPVKPSAPYAKFQSDLWPETLPSERMKADLQQRLIDYRKTAKQHFDVQTFGPTTPDIAATQEAIAREKDPARRATLENLLARQNQKLEDMRAQHQYMVRPGVEEKSLTESGIDRGFPEAVSQQQLYEQQLRRMGLTPGKMAPMGIRLPKDISKLSKAKRTALQRQIRRLETILKSRKSKDYLTNRAIKAASRIARNLPGQVESAVARPLGVAETAAKNVSHDVADIGQRGINKGAKISPENEPLMSRQHGYVPRYAQQLETQVGQLQAVLRQTAEDTSAAAVSGRNVIQNLLRNAPAEAGERVVAQARAAARSLEAAEARSKIPEAKLQQEIQAKQAYDNLLAEILKGIDASRMRQIDPVLPPSVIDAAFAPRTKYGGWGFGRKLSGWMRQAYFIMPIKHGYINVPGLNILADAGFPTAMKGYAIALGFGNPAEVAYYKRLAEATGSAAHYTGPEVEAQAATTSLGAPAERAVEHPMFAGELTTLSKGATQHGDMAQRIARWYYVDHAPNTKNLSFAEKSGIVNEDLVDYSHGSPLIKAMRGAGANFPQWRFTLVPLVGKALLRHPEAFNALFDLEKNFNQDILPQNAPYQMNFGTPAEEGLSGLTNPFGYGEGTIRWVLDTLQNLGQPLTEQASWPQLRKDATGLASLLPGGVVGSAALEPYQSTADKVPLDTRIMSAVMGAHPVLKQTEFSKLMQYYEVYQGLSRDDAYKAAIKYYRDFYHRIRH